MRTGVNPQKGKPAKNTRFQHRVIIPVHIPNLEEEFYRESLEIFKISIKSLLRTINLKTTCITIINNASVTQVEHFLNENIYNGSIDKIVRYSDNRGKVYAVLSEARGSFEPFLTIADADVFFLNGWEKAVFNIFQRIERAGVVAPVPSPHMAFYQNSSVFFDNYLLKGIEYGKIVSDDDCELFLKGMGNPNLFNRENRKYSWKEKQYYWKNFPRAIIGAGHFAATYRKEIFNNSKGLPEVKFANGLEEEFIDHLADEKDLYRLSTSVCYAYHIGNKMEQWLSKYSFEDSEDIENILIYRTKVRALNKTSFKVRKAFFKILKKWKKL